jgi:hypothetical protein
MTKENIKRPTPNEIVDSLEKWDNLENYVLQERSLKKLFTVTYPENKDIDNVLIKVCALNDFYSTHIFSPFTIAKHIISLDIDDHLRSHDLAIVNRIAQVKMTGDKKINFYSFASKYCSHHEPTVYPIYDSFTEKMLLHFKKADKFHKFYKVDLKDYKKYKDIILGFQNFYGLAAFDLKQVDKYLWIRGKEHFKKKK